MADNAQHSEGRERAVIRKVEWHVLPLLCSLSFMCSIDRGALLLSADAHFQKTFASALHAATD